VIDFLEGIVANLSANHVVINVNGVGYGVNITSATYNSLKESNGRVKLHTYLQVRETGVELYGFSNKEDKEVFMALISVNGIGAKSAINILSNTTPDKLRAAIAASDEKYITKVPGLGGKKAQRIIVELKDKFSEFLHEGSGAAAAAFTDEDEYMEALTKLGFQYNQAKEALREAYKAAGDRKNSELIMKEAIKRLGR
jgi:Holliday junction DNA helicase RuvA